MEYHGRVYDGMETLICVCVFSVYEKMKEKMEEVGRTITGFKAKVSRWAREIGLRGNQNIQKG